MLSSCSSERVKSFKKDGRIEDIQQILIPQDRVFDLDNFFHGINYNLYINIYIYIYIYIMRAELH